MSRVCSIHNEYCPDGNCRWCEAPAVMAEPTAFADVIAATIEARIVAMHGRRSGGQKCTCGTSTCPNPADPNDGHGAFE